MAVIEFFRRKLMYKRLCLSVLAVAFCILFQDNPLRSQAPKDAKMECKLIVKKAKLAVGEDPSGEVEIKNISKQVLVITYNTDPWEFLNLEVTDPAGKMISSGKYGHRFSPSTFDKGQKQLVLRPGETYREAVQAFGNSKEGDLTTPGVYNVVAVFEYEKLRAVAAPVMLNVGSK